MIKKTIFLASSAELKEDRKEFEIFIGRKNKDWVEKGVFLDLVIWEDFLDAMSQTRLQDEYNNAIRECDLFVMLFWTKVGQYTEEEFATAFGQFKATNKPFIFTYFKDADISVASANKKDLMSLWAFQEKLSSLGHFYTVYKNVDELKSKFSQQLDKLDIHQQRDRLGAQAAARARFRIGADAETPPWTTFKDADEPWCPEMVVLPGGTFTMGSPDAKDDDPDAYDDERPAHEVSIAYVFALSRYPVTFSQYDYYCDQAGIKEKPHDMDWGRGDRPVLNLTWKNAQRYVEWISEKLRVPYRLPTEAEWEYACRAGTKTRFYCGNELNSKHANYNGSQTSPVHSRSANPWGLHDMHGNVWEYVQDVWHPTYYGAPTDGSAWLDGSVGPGPVFRVVRGGSYSYDAKNNRSAVRCNHPESVADVQHGLRVARTLSAPGG
jgi:formylglycine-generating enzyme required for sulfatase activity